MTYMDWRDVPGDVIRPLYDAEGARWTAALDWNLQPSWDIVEPARAAGRLPGLLARDRDGRVTGWAFYLLHGDILQIGALVGDRAATVRGLLDAILRSPEAALARELTGFLFPRGSAEQAAFLRRRIPVYQHEYLRRTLGPADVDAATAVAGEQGGIRLRAWTPHDAVAMVRLLARAYQQAPTVRCFAPHERLEEWAHYLGQLVRTAACGEFLPHASFIAERVATREPVGLIVTTAVGPRTAHVAQVAVEPGLTRAGIGRRLLRAALGAARTAGHDRVTLVVARENDPARRLYDQLGFDPVASFLFASRQTPLRRAFPAVRTRRQASAA
ncbi:MAG TPA: GNAT family N-acetyltransferase [Vicinamibacterales bacterium]|nr:GNAT family N-acetyltransferase [Vicinamibacterales bacterium]